MSIDLKKEAEKRLVHLKKKATISLEKAKLINQRAKVALVLDYSGSMRPLFKDGTVQRASERLLALASQFDDDGCIEVFLFHHEAYEVGSLCENNFFDFIDKEIYHNKKYKFGRTEYAGAMKKVVLQYFPQIKDSSNDNFIVPKTMLINEPIFVIFITDGNNSDKRNATKLMKESSKLGIFWQFVGIGDEEFAFLQKLDDLKGRVLDNANFFHLNDLEKISDEDLYDRLLIEFPGWIKEAKEAGLIMK